MELDNMEIDDKLVSLITKELLKRLEGGTLSPPGNSGTGEEIPLVLVGGSTGVQASLESRYRIINPDDPGGFPERAEVVICKLGIQALVRVAEGDEGCTPEGRLLLWALLRGKSPVILQEGIEWRCFAALMSRALYEKYSAWEQKLLSYGAKIVKEADLPAVLAGAPALVNAGVSASPPPSVVLPKSGGKRVITETELNKICPVSKGKGQTLVIGKADILTPLAQDYITAMHITVSRSS
jgi:hypothetical protein